MSEKRIENKIRLLFIIIVLSLFISISHAESKSLIPKGKSDAKKTEDLQEIVNPITLQFLVSSRDSSNKLIHRQGKNGESYMQSENLLFRFIIKKDGYVYLISINNNGVFLVYPFDVPINSTRGTHELIKDDKAQYYSLKKIRGDQFFIAIFSEKKMEPEKEIVALFKDIKWLKDGNLDTQYLKGKSQGIEIDSIRIFIKEEIPGRNS